MKAVPNFRRNAGYPHLITRSENRNLRWHVTVANAPAEARQDAILTVVGQGFVDAYGNVTEAGRAALVLEVGKRVAVTTERLCIVWSRTECTYVGPDGSLTEGTVPPDGEVMILDDADGGAAEDPIMIQSVAYVELPVGADASHLCFEHCGRFVHISQGAPLIVADFRRLGREPAIPVHLRNRDGSWRSPLIHRGVRIEEARNGGVLIGPVQPLGNAPSLTLRDPWPDQLDEACHDLAGMTLPRVILDAAWRAIHPEDPELVRADVRRAA